ncbi:MAG: hypothetical protein PWQ30_2007, partial [Euryarchaeota archaeon]|nr:hypothetical protein [Euryarchaeota archaeon]
IGTEHEKPVGFEGEASPLPCLYHARLTRDHHPARAPASSSTPAVLKLLPSATLPAVVPRPKGRGQCVTIADGKPCMGEETFTITPSKPVFRWAGPPTAPFLPAAS